MSLTTAGAFSPRPCTPKRAASSSAACRSRAAQATGNLVLTKSSRSPKAAKSDCPLYRDVLRTTSKARPKRSSNLWDTVCAPELLFRDKPDIAKLQLYFKGLNLKPDQINLTHPETKWTFLHHFAYEGDIELIACALKAGANYEAANAVGKTPLHLAAEANKPAAVMTLLKGGANVSAKTLSGFTPLHLAVLSRHRHIVRILLGNPYATVDVHEDSLHGSPLEMAKDPEIRELLSEYSDHGCLKSALESRSAMPTPKSKRVARLSSSSLLEFSESEGVIPTPKSKKILLQPLLTRDFSGSEGGAVPTPKSKQILLQPLLTRDFSGQSAKVSLDLSNSDRMQLQAIQRSQLNAQYID